MSQRELDEYLKFYYRDPHPERAPAVLQSFAASPYIEMPSAVTINRYFLRRIAQDHPEVVGGYRAALPNLSAAGQAFVRDLLEAIRTALPGAGTVLDRPIATPADNDLHWVEFCLTGQLEPVRRLIDVLERPDLIRARLEQWMASRSWLGRRVGLNRRLRWIEQATGIVCDAHRLVVETEDDLDCLCLLAGLQPDGERLRRAMGVFPFDLSSDDVTHIRVKGTAKWSLAAFAHEHPPVMALCAEEAARRTGRVRRALAAILDPRVTLNEGRAHTGPSSGPPVDDHGVDPAGETDEADSQAFRELLREAEAGSASAQSNLAGAYASGSLGIQDYGEALKWWQRAAAHGVPVADYSIGLLYLHGWGVRKDPHEASRYFRRAAEQGVAPAQYNLGLQYLRGPGLPRNFDEAYRWLGQAAESYRAMTASGLDMRRHRRDAVSMRRRAALLRLLWRAQVLALLYGPGRRRLHLAVVSGNAELAKRLVDKGLDVNGRDKGGHTPLVEAAIWGNRPIAELLIARGADVNARIAHDATALYAAAQHGHAHIVELLLAHGAAVHARCDDGTTALHAAASKGQDGLVAMLLDRGADIHATSTRGATAIHPAAEAGHAGVVELLLARGATADARTRDGETPLLLAALGGHLAVTERLVAGGADVNTRSAYDLTPLKAARQFGHPAVADVLRAHGAWG